MNAPEILDSHEDEFATALHDRLRSELPDLDRILTGATRQGRRRRLRRRVGVGLAGAACLGLAATAYVVVPGAGDDPSSSDAPVATGVDEGHFVTTDGNVSLIHEAGKLVALAGGSSQEQAQVLSRTDLPKPGSGKSYALAERPKKAADLKLRFTQVNDWSPVMFVVTQANKAPSSGLRDEAPVALDLAGWTCEYFPADDKAYCPGPDGAAGGYVVRPAAERDAFLGKSGGAGQSIAMLDGKGTVAGDGTIVGPVRDGIFITVQSGMGFTPELMAQFAQSLTWTD